MTDAQPIYHPGRVTTISSEFVVVLANQEATISCGNFCEYDISWKFVENEDRSKRDKIYISVTHTTVFPYDVKVKLVVKLHRLVGDASPEIRTYSLSVDPNKRLAVIELEDLSQTSNSHFHSCEYITFQLEVFDFDYVGTSFATEVNVLDPSRTHDIVVSARDQKFYLMASYICAWSDWFAEQVYKKNVSEICLDDDVDPDLFLILLNAIHPNMHSEPFEDNMIKVLPLARRFKMYRVVDFCCNRLMDLKSYPEENVITRLKIANECRNNKLKSVCLEAFDESEDRHKWVQNNEADIRSLPAELNQKLIMLVVKDRDIMNTEEDENNEESDDECEIIEKEFSLTDQSRKHNKILVMEGKRFFVDTVYLATWSSYFDNIYYGVFTEDGKQDELVLHHGTEPIFSLMLQIMHEKKAELITDVNVLELMDLAFFYQVPSIVSLCGTYLMDLTKLPDYTILQRLELADTFRHLDLLNTCLETIQQSYNKQEIASMCEMRFSVFTQRNLFMAIASH